MRFYFKEGLGESFAEATDSPDLSSSG